MNGVKGITVCKSNRKWIDLKKYKTASTNCIISVMQELKDMTIAILRDSACERNLIIDTALKIIGAMDLMTLDMSIKRAKVEQYIQRSYPFWCNISARNPQLSVSMMIGQLKEAFPDHSAVLESLCADYVDNITSDNIIEICILTQRLIAYCIFYVHVKRFPVLNKESGSRTYKKPQYCSAVDLGRWSRTYSIELT